MRDRLGTEIIGLNTYQERVRVPAMKAGQTVSYRFTFKVDIRPGVYGLSPGIAYNQMETRYMDWVDNAEILRITDPNPGRNIFGLYFPPKRRVQVKAGLSGDTEMLDAPPDITIAGLSSS